MRVKDIVDENFQDYKITSMFICTVSCNGKCWRELGLDCSICQNDKILKQSIFNISDDKIVERYINNPITKAVVIGGLEPFDQYEELLSLIGKLKERCNDPVVLYTGYKEEELQKEIEELKQFSNIIIKFGRYIPNDQPRYDEVLGVTLASQNQYAKQIS